MEQEDYYPIHIKLALAVYLSLPLSLKTRRQLRDLFFSHLGGFFASHPAYHQWRGHKDPSWREKREHIKTYGKACDPKAPKEHDWYLLALAREGVIEASPALDVIIPVYKGYDDTLRAIYNAVTAPNQTACEIIVINDCSPDKTLVRMLRRLANMGLFTLLENKKNLGFVHTVNRGLALHPERDVIILNADCMVYGDYADRMLAIAHSRPKVATITPLSNNGELCSYPLQWHDNAWRNEMVDPKLDALCWQVNGTQAVDAPTGVGYCMYISRAAMNELGTLDAEKFGRGYGEENDFCMRARAAGYENLIAGGIFVRHVGGSSFGAEKAKRIANAMKMMAKLHPTYQYEVKAWRKAEPDKEMRIALDLARLKIEPKPSMLMVLHTWGGGTEKHVRDMAAWLEEEGVQVLYMMPIEGDCDTCQIGLFSKGNFQKIYTPNLRFRIADQKDALAALLSQLQIKHIHVNHLIGYDEAYYQGVRDLAAQMQVAYDVTLHDYFSICPRTNLIDEKNIYCGEPDVTACNQCILKNGSPVTRYKEDEPEVGAWRQMHHAFLQGARRVYVPNADVSNRLSRYFANVAFQVKPHPEAAIKLPAATPPTSQSSKRKVALIGALYELKGALVLKELAKDAAARNLPLEFHIFGFYAAAGDMTLYRHGNVKETGKYKEKDLPMLVAQAQPEIALFLSIWPETFSYTLSQAYQLGLYPVSFDIGAPAERIRDCGWGTLLPLELYQDVSAINDALVAMSIPTKPEHLAVWEKQATYPNLVADYYELSSALKTETKLKQAV